MVTILLINLLGGIEPEEGCQSIRLLQTGPMLLVNDMTLGCACNSGPRRNRRLAQGHRGLSARRRDNRRLPDNLVVCKIESLPLPATLLLATRVTIHCSWYNIRAVF